MPSLSEKEVKESLNKNEEKLTLRFNTCLILMKDIEHVVKNATNTWKNLYVLQKKSDFTINVSDKDEDNGEHEKVEEIEKLTLYDEEEELGQKATKEDLPKIQNIEETDPEKIAAVVIAQPHFLIL